MVKNCTLDENRKKNLIEILVKKGVNGNFGQKPKFWSKKGLMEILAKNQNFGQKSKFSAKNI